ASADFDQIVDFFNAHTIQYALVVNPTIYVSCIKQLWATATIKKVNDRTLIHALIDGKKVVVSEDVIKRDLHLDDADGFECLPNEEIFTKLAQEVEIPITHASPSPTNALSPSSQDPTPIPHATPPTLPPQEQPTTTSESSMSLLTTLMETCSSLSQKVAELEQDKHTQALEIIKLKKRVKKLEKKKKKSKSTGFKRLRKVGTSQRVESFTDTVVGAQEDASKQREGKIKAINVDEDITLMNVEKDEEVVAMDAELQGRNNQEEVNVASKGVNAVEPTVFDDEEVIMTMAQTLIKMKAKKS
nr:hypothetical protein [Tanacetum cinerariifolium]